MRPDQERVRTLLCDTVKLLCKNGLSYDKELKVQGLLGITLDENEVFIVHINEKLDSSPGTGKDFSPSVYEALNNNNIKEKTPPPREKNNNKRPRKLNHVDGPVSTKKPHINHLQISPSSLFRNKPSAFNAVLQMRDEEEEEISQDGADNDDRNAMRDFYNSDTASESSPKPPTKDIPPPPPLAFYGEKPAANIGKVVTGAAKNNSNDNENNAGSTTADQDFDDLRPPNPSVIGPFIAGIAQPHVTTPSNTGSPEASPDHSWDDIGRQIGPLTQDGQVVLENTGASSTGTSGWEDNDDVEDRKLGPHKQFTDSVMFKIFIFFFE